MAKDVNANMNEVTKLKSVFWDLCNSLRFPISYGPMDYMLVLFMMILQKRDVLDSMKDVSGEEIKKQLTKCILEFTGENEIEIKNIYLNVFGNVINRLDCFTLTRIIQALNDNKDLLKDHLPELFDYLLYRITGSQSRLTGEFIQPVELSEFICGLAQVNENAKVYNPFAGFASFGVFLPSYKSYFGQELNRDAWAIGTLRLIAYNKVYCISFENEDTINKWPPQVEKFDLIISNPPFGLKKNWGTEDRPYKNVEADFLYVSLNSLTKSGKIIALLPQGILFSANNVGIRRELINRDMLEMVITFPGGLLSNTMIPFTIIVVNNDKKDKGVVKFYDAAPCIDKISKKESRVNLHNLNSMIAGIFSAESAITVSNETIIENDFTFNPVRYFPRHDLFLQVSSDSIIVKLSEVASIYQNGKNKQPIVGCYIRISNLRKERFNYKLDVSSLETIEVPINSQRIEKPVLLLALKGNDLKPTFVDPQGKGVYVSQDILSLVIDEEKMLMDYLINELYSNWTLEQVKSLRNSLVIPFITRKDLLSIRIYLPTISKQNESIIENRKAYITQEQNKLNTIRENYEIDIADQNSFLRHQISGKLRNVRSSFKRVHEIFEKQLSPNVSNIYELKSRETDKLTLKEHLEIIERDLASIYQATSKAGKESELAKLEISKIDIIRFVKEYCNELNENDDKSFELIFQTWEEDLQMEGISNVYINGDTDVIRKVFNNLVENAEKHAFNNNYSIKNKLHIDLYYDFEGMQVQIDFSNTGIPWPSNYSWEKAIKKGSKTGANAGDGTGLWYINEIMKKHGGKFDFTDETDIEGVGGDLVSTFELYFPIEIDKIDE